MNAVVFYILAALIVAASAATVGAARLRDAAAALTLAVTAIAILTGVAGAPIVAVAQFAVPLLCARAALLLIRQGGYGGLARPARAVARMRWAGAGVAAAFGALLITVFITANDGWHAGSGTASLITVLHYRTPYALVIAVILAGAGVAMALLIGRTGDDERATDEMLAARRRREERVQRRREDRERAKRRRGEETPVEAGA